MLEHILVERRHKGFPFSRLVSGKTLGLTQLSQRTSMESPYFPLEVLVDPAKSRNDVTHDVLAAADGKKKFWLVSFSLAGILLLTGGYCMCKVWWDGIGMWGENSSVNWAWDITNFVWWIGIGHAGTLISAILLLFRAKWRNSINRSAEGMTLCAVTCAGFYIVAHLGRPWIMYYILPYTNNFGSLWINFNSPLVWDMFAVLTYILISALYWYMGLLPDFATMRERTNGARRVVFSCLSLGWKGDAWNWRRYESVMLTLGFCHLYNPRVALHHFSSLFCNWCNPFRVCHGADPANSIKEINGSGKLYHPESH